MFKNLLLVGSLTLLRSLVPTGDLLAQSENDRTGLFGTATLVIPGSEMDDRARLGHLTGDDLIDGYTLRSSSTLLRGAADREGLSVDLIEPTLTGLWNSDLPRTPNENALWAGRGFNYLATGGFRIEAGPVEAIFAPQYAFSENRDISVLQVIPFYPPDLYPPYTRLWYRDDVTIDMPLQFGPEEMSDLSLGQSSVSVTAGPVALGVATENHWWGPGIRNAIVLSSNAPGFAHAFLRTSEPLRTPVGSVEGRWLVGRLESSDFFRAEATESGRAIGALGLTLRPLNSENVEIGFSRSVYGSTEEGRSALNVGTGVVTDWSRGSPGAPLPDGSTQPTDGLDQVLSLFGRWLIPQARAEIYGEWARREVPESVRDLLINLNHSQGYTVGFQWAHPIRQGDFRLQSEITNLEMATTFRTGRTTSYYVSYNDGAGYTHEGRVIGASIGPGSSSQWIAADYFADRWRIGVTAGRTRWDSDAFFRTPYALLWGIPYEAHDISLTGSLRGGWETAHFRAFAELTLERRLNYLFQNWATGWETAPIDSVNLLNRGIRLSISPVLGG